MPAKWPASVLGRQVVDTQWVVFNHYNSHVCIDALLEMLRMCVCVLCMCVIAYSIDVHWKEWLPEVNCMSVEWDESGTSLLLQHWLRTCYNRHFAPLEKHYLKNTTWNTTWKTPLEKHHLKNTTWKIPLEKHLSPLSWMAIMYGIPSHSQFGSLHSGTWHSLANLSVKFSWCVDHFIHTSCTSWTDVYIACLASYPGSFPFPTWSY